MPSFDDETPRLAEIGRLLGGVDRKIDDFRNEVRQALADKVSKEVYNAEMGAMRERVVVLENRARSLTNTLIGSIATVLVAAVVTWLGLK